jgi:hypothetical protein
VETASPETVFDEDGDELVEDTAPAATGRSPRAMRLISLSGR